MRGPTRWLLTSATFCCLALTTPPAPAAPIPPPKSRPGPYRVDFANLPAPAAGLEYVLFVNAVARDRTSTVVMRTDAAEMTPARLRELFVKSFREDGWRVKALGETAFLIEGRGGKDFSPVVRVTARALRLPAQPTVKRGAGN